ncbi:hypothetical protein PENTCL1PPCAC_380, partial [Pristionchus entomophagus]
EWRIFTHRLCCFSAIAAAPVMAILAAILYIIFGVMLVTVLSRPFVEKDLLDELGMQLFELLVPVVIELVVGFLAILAGCTLQLTLIWCSIFVQLSNFLVTIDFARTHEHDEWVNSTPTIKSDAHFTWWSVSIYVIYQLPSIAVLHCLICCYKLILYRKQ